MLSTPLPSAMGELKRIPHRQCGQALEAQLETAFPHGTSRTLAGGGSRTLSIFLQEQLG
jgi:hypothetical protein